MRTIYKLKILIGFVFFNLGFLKITKAQICNSDGNVVIYSNYDGGIININVDQDIANLKVGICTYEAVEVNFSGTFVGNITQVIYAGWSSLNDNCGLGILTTSINGVDPAIVTLYEGSAGNAAIATTLGSTITSDGVEVPLANCISAGGAGCSAEADLGSNSAAQIVDFFLTEFGVGSSLFLHQTQYECFENEDFSISDGGNCCEEVPVGDPNPIYTGGSSYNFLPDEVQLCEGSIVLDLTFYQVLYQPDIYTGYVWSDGITINPIFTVTEPGTYWFTVTDYCHAYDYFLTDTIVVTACCTQPEPPLIEQPEPICLGEDLPVLNATPLNGGSISWYANEDLSDLLQESNNFTPLNTQGDVTYYVTEIVDSCESLPAVVTFTILPLPVTAITTIGSTSICEGETVTLESANSADSYLWENGDTNQTTITGETGYLSLIVSDNGCTSSDSILIIVNEFPIINLGDDFSTCTESAIIQAPEGFSYLWSDFSTNSSIEVFESGNYSVEVSQANCSSTDEIQVEFGNLNSITLGADFNTCLIPFTLSITNNSSYTYLWNTGATTSEIEAEEAGVYFVEVQSGECIETDSIEVSLGQPPEASLGEDIVVCFQPTYQLTVATIEENITWFDGSNLDTITIEKPGLYWVSVKDDSGCEFIDTVQVDFATQVELGKDEFLCFGEKIFLDGGIGDTYIWNESLGTRFFEVNKPGIYNVQAIYGTCITTDTITINGSLVETNVYFPNAFTPNGDGLNDLFAGIGDYGNIVSYNVKIFSRWGELVFETNNINEKWNGTYQSNYFASEGVYLFIAAFSTTCSNPEKLTLKGMVNLLR
jgi:gliding motility-associated-like protein